MSNPWELTKILRDLEGSPVPQIFNPSEAIFNPLTGANLGNGRYGADNIMWGKTAAGVLVPVQVNADGTVVTSLSGRKVEIPVTRGIKTSNGTSYTLSSPENAKGAIVHLRIYGVTGTFEAGQGIYIVTRSVTSAADKFAYICQTTVNAEAKDQVVSWLPGNSLGDGQIFSTYVSNAKLAGLLPQNQLWLNYYITGTFTEGQGFDMAISVTWVI